MSARVTSSIVWTHAFGQMRIETREDGSVWVDGRLVRDTAPRTADSSSEAAAPDAEQSMAEPGLPARGVVQSSGTHDPRTETTRLERP